MILCNVALYGLFAYKLQTGAEPASALVIVVVLSKMLLPFIALVITGIVHLLAWSKIEKINAEV